MNRGPDAPGADRAFHTALGVAALIFYSAVCVALGGFIYGSLMPGISACGSILH